MSFVKCILKKREYLLVLPFLYYGLRMNRLITNAINVRANSMIKGTVYPPVASSTLLAAVATKEPTITVKVIRAILLEKCFIPKKDDVKAEVIVGHAP